MADIWDKIIQEAKNVSLEKEEKDFILSRVSEHIYKNPAQIPEIITSPYVFRFGLSIHEKRFVPLAVILILVLFGGTSFAANYALPGEALYSVKVNLNEEVESWMALSPNANARFEAVKAERRLKEVEKLTVQKKKITPKAKAQIKENFAKNAQNVKKIVAEIEASGATSEAAEVKAEFEDKLEAHAVVLAKLVSEEEKIVEIDDDGKEDIKEIHALVDEHITELKSTPIEETEKSEATEEVSKETDPKIQTETSLEVESKKEKVEDTTKMEATLTEEKMDPAAVSTMSISSMSIEEEAKDINKKEAIKEKEPAKSEVKEKSDKKERTLEKKEKTEEDKIREEKVQKEVDSILKELELKK